MFPLTINNLSDAFASVLCIVAAENPLLGTMPGTLTGGKCDGCANKSGSFNQCDCGNNPYSFGPNCTP